MSMYDKTFKEIAKSCDQALKDIQSGEYKNKQVEIPRSEHDKRHIEFMKAINMVLADKPKEEPKTDIVPVKEDDKKVDEVT